MISKLVSAFEDQSERVRESACSVLGEIGEKAATNEVISRLVSALEDQSERVRESAGSTLGRIGEKAATNEVISKLVSALEDQSEWVRQSACYALAWIGEKAATNEVVNTVLSLVESGEMDSHHYNNMFRRIFSSSKVMKQVDAKVIENIMLKYDISHYLENISELDFMEIFCETESLDWLRTLFLFALRNRSAVVVVEGKLTLYGKVERYELPVENYQLYDLVIKTFDDLAERLHLRCEM